MGEITVMYLLDLLWKKLWIIVIVAAVLAIGAFGYCEFLATPIYSARSSIIVTNGNILFGQENEPSYDNQGEGVNNTDISASLALANTVTDILKSNNFFDNAAEHLNQISDFDKYGEFTYLRLAGMVSVSRRGSDTLAVDISVKSQQKEEAIDLTNAIAEYSKSYILKYIPQSKTEVMDIAFSVSRTYPQTSIITVAAGLVGAILAFLAVWAIDYLNQTVRSEEEFVAKYDIPLLGSVPDFENVEVVGSYYRKYTSAYGKSYGNSYGSTKQ